MGMSYEIKKWFELNLGWFFIPPKERKTRWLEYLEKKYGHDKSKVTKF